MKYYNWTNFATWKINLEVFSENYVNFYDFDLNSLKEHVEEWVEGNEFTKDLALIFLRDVDYGDIYEAIQDEYKEFHCLNCNIGKDNDGEYCSEKCKKEHLEGYTEF